ncbi:MAG: hypothetical protein ACYCWE_21680 [Eubacteriales bacterium]
MKKENKKIIFILFSAVLIMFLLVLLNNINFDVDMSKMFGGRKSEETVKIHFAQPDYESNIYENVEYMSKNRYIVYTEDPFTSIITETNNEYGNIGKFFLNYFKTLTDGNAELYNNFFTDAYFEDKENKIYDKFTMQKLYDAEVEKLSETLMESGEYSGSIRYTFKISYKIMANDGTFRSDMPSDIAVPQIAEILYNNEAFKINSIIKSKLITE